MRFSDLEIDKLKEIVNIIVGNADTAFAKMLGKKVNMTVPASFVGGIEKVHQNLSGDDEIISAVFLRFDGDLNGAMLLSFSAKSAINLVKLLGDIVESTDDLRQLDESILSEVGNVLLGTSMNTLANFLGLNVEHSVPDIATDRQGAVLDSVLLEIEESFEKTLALELGLNVDGEDIQAKVCYFFDRKSAQKLLESLKDK